jgi:dipeptidase D
VHAVQPSGLSGLEPDSFWSHFEALTHIARPSRHEEPAIEHVRAWAEERGYELVQDSGRNLVVRVPATTGRESAPTVVLQGHLDMVCERDPSSPNDPAEGRIALLRDGDWLKADGTTLGADDGVAIAAMMALVEDESLAHGPLELLMTVAEEVGLEDA